MTEHAFEPMRRAMVASQLRTTGVNDPRVVAAMGAVARERFVPEARMALAYADALVPLGGGRALNPPMALGLLLSEARLNGSERALVIGAATGYSAAVLDRLVASVTALEEDDALFADAKAALAGTAVTPVKGPLAKGWPKAGPYDFILIDGAVEQASGDRRSGGRRRRDRIGADRKWSDPALPGPRRCRRVRRHRLRRCGGGGPAGFAPPAVSAFSGRSDLMRGGLLAAVGLAAIACGGAAQAQSMAAPPPPPVAPVPAGRASRCARRWSGPTRPTRRSWPSASRSGRPTQAPRSPAPQAGRAFRGPPISIRTSSPPFSGRHGRGVSVAPNISMPIYSGGRVRNGVRAADRRVDAGRADLRATEGDIFTEAVAAYMDVIRDRSIVELNRNQVRVLDTNLLATRDRFEVGDLTRTDVAQSDARLALARSSLALAEGRLEASEENYRRVIGNLPPDLQPPPPLPTLPRDPDLAMEVALANNADLAAIAARARAAGYDVSVARGGRLPTISIGSGTRYSNALGTATKSPASRRQRPEQHDRDQRRSLADLPLYQGGAASARVRQAQALRGQLQEQAIGVERFVVSNTRAAYAQYVAANEAIESNTIAVAANQLALEGTRAEQTVGTRNILDVLNAEQELLNSQVLLVTARRDAYVAGFQLLNAMGMAEAEDLNLDGGPLYDPTVNYRRYARSWSDWDDGPRPQPVATRTVPADANSPVTPVLNDVTRPRR